MNILVIGPHPDDQELGMGGAIAKLAAQGHDVLLLDVTDGSPTPRGTRETRLREAAAALDALQPRAVAGNSGTDVSSVRSARAPRPIRRALLDLPNRFVTHSLESRHLMAAAIRAAQPRIIFAPQWEDAHPDHLAVTRIVEDARFDAKIRSLDLPPLPPQPLEYAEAMRRAGVTNADMSELTGPVRADPIYTPWLFYYDCSHLRRVTRPDFCLDITGFEAQKKRSIEAYASQFGPSGAGAKPGQVVAEDFPERMLAYAQFWGSRIGARSAEPFWTREPVGLTGLDLLAG